MWTVLALLPWGTIISIIFNVLSVIYGKSTMGWILELIADKAPLIDRFLTGKQAETLNIALIEKGTRMSPGLDTTTAKILHTIAYAEYVRRTDKAKFARWVANIKAWRKKKDKLPADYFSRFEDKSMEVYTGPNDRT